MHQDPKTLWGVSPMRIGEVLVAEGSITPEQAEEVAELGTERNILFGQAAVLMGVVSVDQIKEALAKHRTSMRLEGSNDISDDIFVLKDPGSVRAQELRRVAQTLALRWFMGTPRRSAISVISADRNEGRSTVAANLACVFAMAGVKTLLIDADLYNSSIQSKFGLVQMATPAIGYHAIKGVDKLSILSAETLFDLEYEQLMQSALRELIESKRAEFDAIFVDTPAASVSNDYQVAGLATGGAMVVTREGKTRARSAARMLNSCDDAGIPIVGGIMLSA